MERKRTIVWDDPQINKRDAVSSLSEASRDGFLLALPNFVQED